MGKGHMPFGYRVENGIVQINEEEAEKIQMLCEGYLSGKSADSAAKEAGIQLYHTSVINMMLNSHYIGDDFYPQILEKETHDAVLAERERRAISLNRNNCPKRHMAAKSPATKFRMRTIEKKYSDPFQQVEYIFGLTEEA